MPHSGCEGLVSALSKPGTASPRRRLTWSPPRRPGRAWSSTRRPTSSACAPVLDGGKGGGRENVWVDAFFFFFGPPTRPLASRLPGRRGPRTTASRRCPARRSCWRRGTPWRSCSEFGGGGKERRGGVANEAPCSTPRAPPPLSSTPRPAPRPAGTSRNLPSRLSGRGFAGGERREKGEGGGRAPAGPRTLSGKKTPPPPPPRRPLTSSCGDSWCSAVSLDDMVGG